MEQNTNQKYQAGAIIGTGIRCILFLAVFLCLFFCLQKAFIPKWIYPTTVDDHTSALREYASLPEDSISVLFVGTSHVSFGVQPMQLYKEQGITSFSAAMTRLNMAETYYHLQNLLRTQTPEVVMMDASALYMVDVNTSSWRYVLDVIFPFGKNKIMAAEQYADQAKLMNPKESVFPLNERFNSMISALVPIYYYHDRWEKLRSFDLSPQTLYHYEGKGYYYSSKREAAEASLEDVEQVAQDMAEVKEVEEKRRIDGQVETVLAETDQYTAAIAEDRVQWLEKIKALCDERGIRLVLFKVPVISSYRGYTSSWTKPRSDAARELAGSLGIPFFDVMYDSGIELDPAKDFRDKGMHLNYMGAKKVTSCIGNFLVDELGVAGGQHNDAFEKTLPSYEKIDKVTELCMESNWNTYFDLLEEQIDGKTVFVSIRGSVPKQMAKKVRRALKRIGLADKLKIRERAYAGVSVNGISKYEASAYTPVRISYPSEEQPWAVLESVCDRNTSQKASSSSILVDQTEYSMNRAGVNIVVVDNETQDVIDSICLQDAGEDKDPALVRYMSADKSYSLQYVYDLWTLDRTASR